MIAYGVLRELYGRKNQVQFTPSLIRFLTAANNDSVVLLHNHPNSSSFSDADMRVLSVYRSIKQLRVIGHNGTTYLLEVGKGSRPVFQVIQQAYIDEN